MITFNDLYLREADMLPIRRELYHSTGAGFYVFPKFLTEDQTAHMRSFWSTLGAEDWHQQYLGADKMFLGCPNYYLFEEGEGQLSYFNFLWNHPADELTHAVAFNIQLLRNRIESRNIYREIFPLDGRSASYRMVLSRNIKTIVVPHRDWVGEGFDPRRLQVTLFLAEKGKDYEGVGFGIETNYGKSMVFGDDVEIHAGDLVLWRHGNLHFAREVSSAGTVGFMRMIIPNEEIVPREAETGMTRLKAGVNAKIRKVKNRIKKIPYVESHALPVYRRMKRGIK